MAPTKHIKKKSKGINKSFQGKKQLSVKKNQVMTKKGAGLLTQVDMAVDNFRRNGISMKQLFTRLVNPVNPDRILYKNSFFLEFLDPVVVCDIVYKKEGDVTIVKENETHYIYRKDYLKERMARKGTGKPATNEQVSAVLLEKDSESTVAEKDAVFIIDYKDKITELQKVAEITGEVVLDTMNRISFARLNDIPIIDRELVGKGRRFDQEGHGTKFLLFQERYNDLYKFFHVYKYQVSRLFSTSSEMIKFKKVGYLLETMYAHLNESDSPLSLQFKMDFIKGLAIFAKGSISKFLLQKLFAYLFLKNESDSKSGGATASSSINAVAPLENRVSDAEALEKIEKRISLMEETVSKLESENRTRPRPPNAISTYNHGRIIGKLLKNYDIDSPLMNITSLKFAVLAKKHPPFLEREAINACKVAVTFLEKVKTNSNILSGEMIKILSKKEGDLYFLFVEALNSNRLSTELNNETLEDAIIILGECRDEFITRHVSEAVEKKINGGKTDKRRKTKKMTGDKRKNRMKGSGILDYLTKKVTSIATGAKQMATGAKQIARSAYNQTIGATSNNGVDGANRATLFYELLSVIFHLTYTNMVDRLLENIFKNPIPSLQLRNEEIIHFFMNIHTRNLMLHTIPTFHYLVSLRLASNDIWYSSTKLKVSDIESLDMYEESQFIPMVPVESSSFTVSPTLSFGNSKSDIGATDTDILNKYYTFVDRLGEIKTLKLKKFIYSQSDNSEVEFTFESTDKNVTEVFRTPFTLQRMYKVEDHIKNGEMQNFIHNRLNRLNNTVESTDALESYLLNKHLFINGMYAGFVKKVTKVQKTSSVSEYKAVELTLTSDGVKEDKVTLPFDTISVDKRIKNTITSFLSKKILRLVQPVDDVVAPVKALDKKEKGDKDIKANRI